MVDSDSDRWYDWKRDGFIETLNGPNVNASNELRLAGQRDSPLNNGLIQRTATPPSSRSSAEVRFINPAIYAETLNHEDEEREIEIRVKVSSKDNGALAEGNFGDSPEMSDIMSTLSIKNDLATSFEEHAGDQASIQDTYRCYSLNSPGPSLDNGPSRSKSVVSCRPSNRVERRCRIVGRADGNDELCSARLLDSEVQRFTLNGHRVVQVSTASLSSISVLEARSVKDDPLRKIPYSEWMRRKQQAARQKKEEDDEAERKRQMDAERLAREKEEREARERENFLRWTERKRKEEERKKRMAAKELDMQKKLKEFEDKSVVMKTLCLRQWEHKKKEEEKARQKREAIKQKQIDEEKKKRLEESTKAYEVWRKNARNKPKPATQGLLPHQKAKPSYVNPTPWQGIVDEPEVDEAGTSNGRMTHNQLAKNSSKKSSTYYQ
nr:eukaryotic translation initiation factor 3 subunit A isoform X2 [Megalopta genalis]